MTSPSRLMANGMSAALARQLGQTSTPAAGLVGTGATKAAAVQLLAGANIIATCASAGVAAFQLQSASGSPIIVVENQGASPALVFAFGATEKINALSAGASFSVTNAKRAIFIPAEDASVTPAVPKWIAILSA